MTFNPATRALDNGLDAARTFPSSALTPNVLRDSEGAIGEKITGPAALATVKLARPAVRITHVTSFVTATGVASAKEHLTEGVDYSVVKQDATGVATLTELLGTNYSAATWVVFYSPLSEDKTIGGVSSAKH